jgi:hypothetical protein
LQTKGQKANKPQTPKYHPQKKLVTASKEMPENLSGDKEFPECSSPLSSDGTVAGTEAAEWRKVGNHCLTPGL